MSLFNSRFVLPSPIVLTQVPAMFGAGIQYYTQPSDDCSCGASKTVCPSSEPALAEGSPRVLPVTAPR